MGFHRTSSTRDKRTPRAHLERKGNGGVYAVYKLGFTKDAPRFEYCFIGDKAGTLTYEGKVIDKHPTFKEINAFEGWCMRHVAENDL